MQAEVVEQTRIDWNEKELLYLMANHLKNQGLVQSANILAVEAGLTLSPSSQYADTAGRPHLSGLPAQTDAFSKQPSAPRTSRKRRRQVVGESLSESSAQSNASSGQKEFSPRTSPPTKRKFCTGLGAGESPQSVTLSETNVCPLGKAGAHAPLEPDTDPADIPGVSSQVSVDAPRCFLGDAVTASHSAHSFHNATQQPEASLVASFEHAGSASNSMQTSAGNTLSPFRTPLSRVSFISFLFHTLFIGLICLQVGCQFSLLSIMLLALISKFPYRV